jgi:multidrug efflux pump subunit AcrA (membrane-fusion protein)
MPTGQRKATILAASGLGLLALGLGLFLHLRSADEWVHPRTGPLVEAVYGVGTVTAWNTFNLKISLANVVARLDVLEGQAVAKGAPLMSFADGPFFRAPFAGVVTAVNYKAGETVPPQMTVLSLTDLAHRYILVSLEQSGALRVRQGQLARLTFEDIHMTPLDGTVVSIYPQGDQFLVHIDVPVFPDGVLVGMVADVAIQVAARDSVLQIPVTAIHHDEVRLRRGGQELSVAVKVGADDGQWAEILGGAVRADDLVFVPRAAGS